MLDTIEPAGQQSCAEPIPPHIREQQPVRSVSCHTGIDSMRRRLIPMVMVVSEEGQDPQAPCNLGRGMSGKVKTRREARSSAGSS